MTRLSRPPAATSLFLVGALISAARAAAQTPLFEVEKSDATKLLQVHDDAGLVVQGALQAGVIPATGRGVRLMWYPGKAAFRAGRVEADQWDDANVGQWSAAFGENTTASGDRSVAMGKRTMASGDVSTALGFETQASGAASLTSGNGTIASGQNAAAFGEGAQASGTNALATGVQTQASGPNALATGFQTRASGREATAMGISTVASGAASVAMGSGVVAQGDGSFIFGDRNTQYGLTAAPNTFNVRAFGGIALNTAVAVGCDLPAGSGSWACTSSRLAKEGFEDLDGEEVLGKLAAIPIQRWRYLGNGAAHVGPTAEDFRAAFGLGESATKIAAVDADGIALRAIQALERRTAALQEKNTALLAELATVRAEVRAVAAGTPTMRSDEGR